MSALAIRFCFARGYILYWGDALAHLNNARRIIDSRTPGWDQIGTAWLPLPHLLMLPFVGSDWLWRTGLAGSIPAGACYVLGGVFLFLAVRRVFASAAAGAAACLLLALNPNLLYLQAVPMTESVLLACFTGLLYFTVLFRATQSLWAVAAAGVCACAGTLTRYEGWFLLPFATGYILLAAQRRRVLAAALFGAIAALGPLYWLAHNWWYYGRFLEFYDGPYSARGIYERSLRAGMARYGGDHDWAKAWLYYRTALRLVAGTPLLVIGVGGFVAALVKRAFWPVLFLALPLAFYLWSMYSGAAPIFVGTLWPVGSYYNTRYAVGVLPLLAFGGAAIAALLPARARTAAAALLVLAAAAPWLGYPQPESWICWKESQVNSEARRAWNRAGAEFLQPRYGPRDGIFTTASDVLGIYVQAGIPIRELLQDGNQPHFQAAVNRPDLFLWERWAVAISGDTVATAMSRARKTGPRYDLVKTIALKGAPVIEIYRRVR